MEAKASFAHTFMQFYSRLRQWYKAVLFPALVIGATLFYITYYLRAGIVGPELALEWKKAFYLVMAVHCLVLLGKMFEKKPIEMRILLLNAGWMFLSRCIIGNYTFEFNDVCFWAILMCLMFASGVSLDHDKRQLLLALVAIELVAITALWAIIAIPTVMNNHSVEGFEGIVLYPLGSVLPNQHIRFYALNRNITALYFLIASSLLLYQCFRSSKLFWRVIAIAYLPLAFVGIAVQRSDTVYILFAILISTTVVVLCCQDLHEGLLTKRGVRVVLWFICTALMYVCLDGSMSLVQNRAEAAELCTITTHTATRRAMVGSHVTQASLSTNPYARDTLYGVISFNGRTEIWAATIPMLQENPERAFLGMQEQTAMDAVNTRIVRIDGEASAYIHMHNMFLQQLVISGIPGLVLYMAFLGLLLCRCFRTFAQSCSFNMRCNKVISLLLMIFLLYGMMEPLLYSHIAIASLAFCLIAGFFVGEASGSRAALA